jgi:hypothetical protein
MAKYCVPDERGAVNHSTSLCALVVISMFAAAAQAGSERLLATGGVTQIEGSGGGGLNPWALITGLATNAGVGGSADCTYVRPQHFSFTSCGVAAGIHDRLELSYARQTFDLDDVAPGKSIRQDTVGAKLRVSGDAVFDQDRPWPQIAVGLQYKLLDGNIRATRANIATHAGQNGWYVALQGSL